MKKTFLICFSLIVSCSSIQQQAVFQKIQYKTITRGYSSDILLQDNILKYYKNTKESRSLILTQEVKDSLNNLLKKINIKAISQLKIPSKKYQYDGAMYTTLKIVWNGKTYTSGGFDHDNPPEELKPFVSFLLNLI